MGDLELLKTLERSLWIRRWLVACAADVLLVVLLITWLTDPLDRTFSAYAIGIGGLWLVQVVLGLKNFLAGLASLKLDNPLLERTFLQLLRANKMPAPDWRTQSFNYLAELADDPDESTDTRLRAMALSATWSTVMHARGMIATIAISDAWDKAIQRYAEEHPVNDAPGGNSR